jgi:hypothetical protein
MFNHKVSLKSHTLRAFRQPLVKSQNGGVAAKGWGGVKNKEKGKGIDGLRKSNN